MFSCQASCPSSDNGADHADHAPHIVAAHPEQGWSLRCDGAIVFDDTGELTADGRGAAPLRVPPVQPAAAAWSRSRPSSARSRRPGLRPTR